MNLSTLCASRARLRSVRMNHDKESLCLCIYIYYVIFLDALNTVYFTVIWSGTFCYRIFSTYYNEEEEDE